VLPIVLAVLGGLLGGVVGVVAMLGNLAVARTGIPSVVKGLIMVVIAVAAYAALVVVTAAFGLAPRRS